MPAESTQAYRERQAGLCRERAEAAASHRERALWLDLAALWLGTIGEAPGRP